MKLFTAVMAELVSNLVGYSWLTEFTVFGLFRMIFSTVLGPLVSKSFNTKVHKVNACRLTKCNAQDINNGFRNY